jgi:hypothetical protein
MESDRFTIFLLYSSQSTRGTVEKTSLRQQTHHDSIPPISPLITAQDRQPIEAFGQDDILAVPQLVCELDFVGSESTPSLDLAGRVVFEREN